jgi:hypothetical protein
VLRRLESQVSTNWGTSGPPGLGRADYYSVQVTAWLQIRTSGAYTFFLGVDDNMRLIIDGTVVGSSTCCGKYDPFTVNLAAGYRRVVVQYINYGGNGYGVLHWDGGVVRGLPPDQT